jgi:threonine/homoserine/homoserine lactone efflux protein
MPKKPAAVTRWPDFFKIFHLHTLTGRTRSTGIIIMKGVLVSLMNPYWYIWWISIGAAFIIKSVKFDAGGVTAFFTGHISADFIWYLFIGFLISTGRRFLNQKIYNGILITCSLFLFYLGIRFIVDAII